MKNKIIIKDAKGNNLKNLSIEIPKNKIVLITGVSGSGKTLLAMTDTQQRLFYKNIEEN